MPISSAISSPDVLVVGGGIVGLATAYALAEHFRVVVLEAESDLAKHQTGHNSGVVHSGLYYAPGSFKARLCTEGRRRLLAFCAEHGVPLRQTGKLVVAAEERELPALNELERRGQANGLEELERLDADDIPRREPHARGVAGLWVGDTALVDFRAVARALAKALEARGGRVETGQRVVRVVAEASNGGGGEGRGIRAILADGSVRTARFAVACGGLESDRLARRCGLAPTVRIVPFRGEYYEVVEGRRDLAQVPIYPVPDPRFPFLGVHLTPTVDHRLEAGPNALLALHRTRYGRFSASPRDAFEVLTDPAVWRLGRRFWRTGAAELGRSFSRRRFAAALARLVPAVRPEDLRPAGRGIRAQAVDDEGNLVDDFRFAEAEGLLCVLNAPSPAATASLAIGEHLARRVETRLAKG